jgi:hypothetical protein
LWGIAGHERALHRRHEVARPVDLAVDERQVGLVVRRIGDHAQRRQLRLARLPIARIAPQLPDLVTKDAHLGERPGADGVGIGERQRVGDFAPDVLGQHRLLHQLDQARHERPLQGQLDGARVDGAHARQELPQAVGVERAILVDELEAVDDVGGGERRAVRPAHAVAQMQRELQVIGRPGEVGGEPRNPRAGDGVPDDERLVDAAARGPARAADQERVEVAHPGAGLLDRDGHDVACRRRRRGTAGGDEGQRERPFHCPAGA